MSKKSFSTKGIPIGEPPKQWPQDLLIRKRGTIRALGMVVALLLMILSAPGSVHAWDLLPDDPAFGNPPVAPANCPAGGKTIAFTAQNGGQSADQIGTDPVYGLPIFQAYSQDGNTATATVTNLSNVDVVQFYDAPWGVAQRMETFNGGDHPVGAFMEVTIKFNSPVLNPAFMIVEADSGGATTGFLDQYTATGFLAGVPAPYDALYSGSGIDTSNSNGTTADWSGIDANYGVSDPENRGLVYYGGVNGGSAWVDTIVVKYVAGRATSNQLAGIQMPEGCVSFGTAKEVFNVVDNGDDTFTINYNIRATNGGTLPIYNLQLVDNLAATFGAANIVSTSVVSSTNVSLNPNYDGITDTNLLLGNDTQSPNGNGSLTLAVTVSASIAGDGPFDNQIAATSTVLEDPTSPQMTDLSDNGSNPAANDTNEAGGADDPTPVGLPGISVIKSIVDAPTTNLGANATVVDAGDQINYTFVVANTGSVALDPVSLSDSLVTGISCPQTSLAIGASMTCTADTYTLTQADLDAGGVENTAYASGTPPPSPNGLPSPPITDDSDSGTDPSGAAVTDPENTETDALDSSTDSNPANDPTVILIAPAPSIQVVKTIDNVSTAMGSDATVVDTGDQITYGFLVENTGNVTLDPVTVTDSLVANLSCSATTLAPGATMTCTADPYTLTQADVDGGGVENTANAVGTPPPGPDGTPADPVNDTSDDGTSGDETTETDGLAGDTNGDPTDDPTVYFVPPAPSIQVVKSIDSISTALGANAAIVDAGDQINYIFTVSNTGNVTLDPISVSDPMVTNVTCAVTALAPNGSTTCSADLYTLTQADIDAGGVQNLAVATGTPPDAPDGTPATPVTDDSDAGTDPDGAPVDNPDGSETDSLDPANNDGDGTNDPTVALVPPMPMIQIIKAVTAVDDTNGSGLTDAGDQISYSFMVTNTGNVTLNPVSVNDPMLTNIVCSATSLAPSVGMSCTADPYVLTQADVDAGGVENSADATGTPPNAPDGTPSAPVSDNSDAGTDPDGAPVTDPDGSETDSLDPSTNDGDSTNDPTVSLIAPMPSIEIVKSISAISTDLGLDTANTDAGDTIDYTFTVVNTGNVTLNPVTVSDSLLTGIVCTATSLAPSASMSCTADPYTITQNDVNNAGVENSADATGTPPPAPDGTPATPVMDDSDSGTDTDGSSVPDPDATETDALNPTTNDGDSTNDPTVLSIPPDPSIQLTKESVISTDANGNGVLDAGDTISYTFTVLNTGNVTLDPISVTDAKIANISCTLASLPPSGSTSCSGDLYTITQADMDAGYMENTATANGTPPPAPDGTPADPVSDTSDDGTDGGDEATETPDGMGGTNGDPTDDPTVTSLVPNPSIMLVKKITGYIDANANNEVDAGDQLEYTFTTTNDGTVTLNDIAVTDNKVANIVCAETTLGPGFSTTCAGDPYTLTLADLDAGGTENRATVEGTPPPAPDGTPADPVSDISDDGTNGDENTETGDLAGDTNGDPTDDPTVFTIPVDGSIELRKSFDSFADMNGNGLTDAGDQISYSFTAINTGNVTLSNVAITDDKVANIACNDTTLVPNQSTTCIGDVYTITQADVDAGGVENTATVNATDPIGAPISDTSDSDEGSDADETDSLDTSTNGDPTDDPTVAPIPALPSIQVVKEISGISDLNASGTTDLGDEVSFTFTVSNTGNVTLNPISVSDSMVSNIVCAATSLAPATSTTCTADPHVITQNDVNAGGIENRATAEGTPPPGPDGTPSDPVSDVSDDGTGAGDENTETPKLDGSSNGDPGDDPTVLLLEQNPAITLEKGSTFVDESGDGLAQAGETIAYTFTVMNTGDVDLTNIVVNDPLIGVIGGPLAFLAVGGRDSATFSGVYALTQADINAGIFENTATVDGTPPPAPDGTPSAPVSDTSDDPQDPTDVDPNGDGNPDDPTDTLLPQNPAINLLKRATFNDESGDSLAQVGETISYRFIVSNIGNVDLTDVVVNDPMITVNGGPIALLAVGDVDSTTFTGVYALTQADINAGVVENRATTEGSDPSGNPVTDSSDDPQDPTDADPNGDGNPDDPTNTPLAQAPAIGLEKSGTFVDESGDGVGQVGETIAYSFTVTNLGNVDLTDVTVSDALITVNGGPLTLLPVGGSDSTTFAGVYTLTQADINAEIVENTATTDATDPSGNPVTDRSDDPLDPMDADPDGDGNPDDPTNTALTPAPAISLQKVGTFVDENGDGAAQVGETISYLFTVQNIGNVDLTNVTVSDPMLTVAGEPIAILTVGAVDSTTFTGVYALTQADINAGVVENRATTEGSDPNGNPVTDDSDDPTISADVDPNGDGNPDDPTVTSLIPLDVDDGGTTSSFSSFYWVDADGDGIKDADEEPVAGAEVIIYDLDGNIIAQTTTDENGLFEFENLPPGDYQLQYIPPAGFEFTQRNAGGGPNSGADESGFMPLTLNVGSNTAESGAGIVGTPTAVNLSRFTAELRNNTELVIRWTTSAEIDTDGFHVLQSSDQTLQGARQVTSQIISSQGSAGGSYEVVLPYDEAVDPPFNLLSYWLYEIEITGTVNYYGPTTVDIDASQVEEMIFLPFLSR